MLENHIYNLHHQLVQENKSLWRIKNHYLEDAGDCAKCQEFWKKMEADKEEHITELTQLIKEHLS
ncbi:MAG: hypothetical protein Q8P37_00625 [Candidatus Spechtbacteria bacterium]|nr:hypothetical protein [Candidatus Spechtbacteria bacterium]